MVRWAPRLAGWLAGISRLFGIQWRSWVLGGSLLAASDLNSIGEWPLWREFGLISRERCVLVWRVVSKFAGFSRIRALASALFVWIRGDLVAWFFRI